MNAVARAEREALESTNPRPQEGPQERFAQCSADIAIYGGSAGSGKTWAILLEPLYHISVPNFVAVIFRRDFNQIENAGGLWDESINLYTPLGCKTVAGNVLTHKFGAGPTAARVEFAHLHQVNSVLSWQGAQIPLIMFDELTHFEESQFFYMLSRNRSMCGVRPYVRATCNPDADSWVARLIEWWIDQATGLPIPERSGVIRWFARISDTIVWGDSQAELIERYGNPDLPADHHLQLQPKSFTFIGASIFDNKKLLKKDPGYLANLKALPLVERERLLGGNWKIRKVAGLLFKRHWVKVVHALPSAKITWVRHWDLAATEQVGSNDPDWTVGVKLGRYKPEGHDEDRFIVADRVKMRESPGKVKKAVKDTADLDGRGVKVGLPQDPGQAGKAQARDYAAHLVGWSLAISPESGDKVTRFEPFSAQCEAGNVDVLRASWNEDFFDCLEGFPDAAHDDDADAASGAFNRLLAAPRYQYPSGHKIESAVSTYGPHR